jgi:SAM-dependent methyltransferase
MPKKDRLASAARRLAKGAIRAMTGNTYSARLDAQIEQYRQVENIHDLPDIFHYWSNKHLRPRLNAVMGADSIADSYALPFAQAVCAAGSERRLLSIGAGDCSLEVAVARRLIELGIRDFRLTCLEISPHLLARAQTLIDREGLAECVHVRRTDINEWKPDARYAGVMANHSLHHLVELEHVFSAVDESLEDGGLFVSNDMVGRNGHMRWPEVLEFVEGIWSFMPDRFKFNRQLGRFEANFVNWDCSNDGFEGIRAQDILPLLTARFGFRAFLGFGGIVDVFVDRAFGHNLDPSSTSDAAFIDFLQLLNDRLIDGGVIKPTTMFAVMCKERDVESTSWRHWSPEFSVRPVT